MCLVKGLNIQDTRVIFHELKKYQDLSLKSASQN